MSFQLEEATISETRRALHEGRVSARELVLGYYARIADFDQEGPHINSVAEMNPDALHIAEALDHELASGTIRGPLHGIPILLKDNINTGDKMHTTAGSLALSDVYAPEDAHLVKRVREAGAVILGKTNMTEFANFMSHEMPNGYSSRGGQVLNPYDAAAAPGGSSSGSGAAVTCNFGLAAVGTETSGSVLDPSHLNGIVGIKPTIGLVSRSGIVPISVSQDTAGPMARCVADAALLLSVLKGMDPDDPVTVSNCGRTYQDYTAFLNPDGLKGARIGVPREGYCDGLLEEQRRIWEEAIDCLRRCGAEVVDPADIPAVNRIEDSPVKLFEFKTALNHYLSKLGPHNRCRTLADIIAYNDANRDVALKYGQYILLQAEQKTSGMLKEPYYLRGRLVDLQLCRTEGIDAVLAQHRLDALLFPGSEGASIAARAGYPSITVPAGHASNSVPFGITFTGQSYSEPVLIRLAYAYEQASKKRKAPVLP